MTSVFERIEQELNRPFGLVDLWIEGYHVRYHNVLIKRRMMIMTYVNGKFSGEWFRSDDQGRPVHPEARFMRPRSKKMLPAKEVAAWRRINPKRAAELAKKKIHWFDPCFDTPESLVRHLKKHFSAIEIIPRPAPDPTAMEVIVYGDQG